MNSSPTFVKASLDATRPRLSKPNAGAGSNTARGRHPPPSWSRGFLSGGGVPRGRGRQGRLDHRRPTAAGWIPAQGGVPTRAWLPPACGRVASRTADGDRVFTKSLSIGLNHGGSSICIDQRKTTSLCLGRQVTRRCGAGVRRRCGRTSGTGQSTPMAVGVAVCGTVSGL